MMPDDTKVSIFLSPDCLRLKNNPWRQKQDAPDLPACQYLLPPDKYNMVWKKNKSANQKAPDFCSPDPDIPNIVPNLRERKKNKIPEKQNFLKNFIYRLQSTWICYIISPHFKRFPGRK